MVEADDSQSRTEQVVSEIVDFSGLCFGGIKEACVGFQFVHKIWREIPFLTQLKKCVLDFLVFWTIISGPLPSLCLRKH